MSEERRDRHKRPEQGRGRRPEAERLAGMAVDSAAIDLRRQIREIFVGDIDEAVAEIRRLAGDHWPLVEQWIESVDPEWPGIESLAAPLRKNIRECAAMAYVVVHREDYEPEEEEENQEETS